MALPISPHSKTIVSIKNTVSTGRLRKEQRSDEIIVRPFYQTSVCRPDYYCRPIIDSVPHILAFKRHFYFYSPKVGGFNTPVLAPYPVGIACDAFRRRSLCDFRVAFRQILRGLPRRVSFFKHNVAVLNMPNQEAKKYPARSMKIRNRASHGVSRAIRYIARFMPCQGVHTNF